jgi:hypothetical protein
MAMATHLGDEVLKQSQRLISTIILEKGRIDTLTIKKVPLEGSVMLTIFYL